jgi:hypothetical protein
MSALNDIPDGLRLPLLAEYQSIVQNYAEHRWTPSELSGGRFCEVVYTILRGYAEGSYAASPGKPDDFVSACRKLENNTNVPRSFRILIPRLLPALFEVRNNRGVGHVGGDVDPNHMDALFVLSNCNWVMAELVRVYHKLSAAEAQRLVDSLVERRTPLIWEGENVRRVLDSSMKKEDQVLVLVSTMPAGKASTSEVIKWVSPVNGDFMPTLRYMHNKRLIELSTDEKQIEILPPGNAAAAELMRQRNW